jgi:hypothetical protein
MRSSLPAIALAVLAGACATSDSGSVRHVVFSTGTLVGVDIEALGTNGQGARVGYQRLEFVSLPTEKPDGSQVDAAFPVVSLFAMDTGSLLTASPTMMRVLQVFATGEAATQVKAPEAVASAAKALALAALWTPEMTALTEQTVEQVNLAWAKDPAAADAAASATLAGGKPLTLEGLEEAIDAFQKRHPNMVRYEFDWTALEGVPATDLAKQIARELAEIAAWYEEAQALEQAVADGGVVTGG